VNGVTILPAPNLLAVVAHLCRHTLLEPYTGAPLAPPPSYPDLADVKGQVQARRALEVAASGQHSLLFYGPPGTGKSMLAQRLPGLLPPLNDAEALETAAIHSVEGSFRPERWRQRPIRARTTRPPPQPWWAAAARPARRDQPRPQRRAVPR
jgi:magnesium chelatase family protein